MLPLEKNVLENFFIIEVGSIYKHISYNVIAGKTSISACYMTE